IVVTVLPLRSGDSRTERARQRNAAKPPALEHHAQSFGVGVEAEAISKRADAFAHGAGAAGPGLQVGTEGAAREKTGPFLAGAARFELDGERQVFRTQRKTEDPAHQGCDRMRAARDGHRAGSAALQRIVVQGADRLRQAIDGSAEPVTERRWRERSGLAR